MAESSSRRGILIGSGALVILAGLVAAVVLWTLGDDRRREAVQGFARAPVGCDTTLDFAETGEYFVFIERAGTLGEIRGDCNIEGSYDLGSRTPEVELALVDPQGAPVELGRSVTDIEYNEGGFVGAAEFTVDISETDDHVIRVESPDDEIFAVAIGADPGDGVAAFRAGAAAAGIFGLLLGAGLILFGARSGRVTAAVPQWAPARAAQPPGFVPGNAPLGPPVYGQQTGPPPYRQPGPPQYGQPGQPQYGAAPAAPGGYPAPYNPVPPPPAPAQQPPAPVAGQPQAPGQPGWGPAAQPPAPSADPQPPSGRAQPNDWAPQSPDAASAADLGASVDDVVTRPRDGRGEDPERTQERPPPPPPN